MDSCQNVSGQLWVLEKLGGATNSSVPNPIEESYDDVDVDDDLPLD